LLKIENNNRHFTIRPGSRMSLAVIRIRTNCFFCDVRAEAEERADDIKITTEAVISVSYEVKLKKRLAT